MLPNIYYAQSLQSHPSWEDGRYGVPMSNAAYPACMGNCVYPLQCPFHCRQTQFNFTQPSTPVTPPNWPTGLHIGSAMDHSHKNPNKIFVGGLGQRTTNESLRAYFMNFGRVLDVAVIRDRFTGKSKGFGFVSFNARASVDLCIQRGQHYVDGIPVDLRRSEPLGQVHSVADDPALAHGVKVHVCGLPTNVTYDAVRSFFETSVGPVKLVYFIYDKNDHKFKGSAFLLFMNEEDATKALGWHKFGAKTIVVRPPLPNSLTPLGKGNLNGIPLHSASSILAPDYSMLSNDDPLFNTYFYRCLTGQVRTGYAKRLLGGVNHPREMRRC